MTAIMIVSDTYFADWVQENIVVNNFITLPSETIFPILAIHSELMPLGHLAIGRPNDMDSKCITDKNQFKMFDIIKDTNLWSQSCSQ